MNSDLMESNRPNSFHSTNWSVVLHAGLSTDSGRQSLADLCETYWYPLYAFLRRRGANQEDAGDQIQGFFLHLLSSDGIAKADPARGRFRSFLLASLKNFSAAEFRRQSAVQRGGKTQMLSIDDTTGERRYQQQHVDVADPELLFEISWVSALLQKVREELKRNYQLAGKQRLYEELSPRLAGGSSSVGLSEIAARMGTTTGATTMALRRMRQRFGDLLRDEIARTLADPADVETELNYLLTLYERVRARRW